MDSAGVHAVLDASHRSGGHLAVVCPKGPVRQVIELLGLTEMLNVVSSLDEYRARRAGARDASRHSRPPKFWCVATGGSSRQGARRR